MTLDEMWSRIEEHEGQVFSTKNLRPFTYQMKGNAVHVDRNRNIPKGDFDTALACVPFDAPTDLPKHLQGRSYIYGIMTDPRVGANPG